MATKIEGLVIRDRIYTVSQVTEIVKTALEVAFPQVWIEGEVSGCKKAASGHVFFNLKDDRSVIKAVIWQSTARKVAFDLKDGLQVVCRGKVSVYEPRGDYQLYVDLVEPKGKGALQLAFEQLKEKLRAEGLFDDKRKRKRPLGGEDAAASDELKLSQEEIHSLRLAMRASEEELQAANEELQSTNEELQSANEELTTSKEEAQSMNEELQTINSELQIKLDDLALAQSDMQNLLNSTDIATLFLDKDLNVRRFTDQVTRIIPMRDVDIGRPLSDLASTLNYPQLHDDAKETLRTLAFSEKEISTTDGHWFTVRIMPYRTVANVIQGAVITFVDITAAKELESRLRRVQSLAPQGDGINTESR